MVKELKHFTQVKAEATNKPFYLSKSKKVLALTYTQKSIES